MYVDHRGRAISPSVASQYSPVSARGAPPSFDSEPAPVTPFPPHATAPMAPSWPGNGPAPVPPYGDFAPLYMMPMPPHMPDGQASYLSLMPHDPAVGITQGYTQIYPVSLRVWKDADD